MRVTFALISLALFITGCPEQKSGSAAPAASAEPAKEPGASDKAGAAEPEKKDEAGDKGGW